MLDYLFYSSVNFDQNLYWYLGKSKTYYSYQQDFQIDHLLICIGVISRAAIFLFSCKGEQFGKCNNKVVYLEIDQILVSVKFVCETRYVLFCFVFKHCLPLMML